jgi:hypothetical protein
VVVQAAGGARTSRLGPFWKIPTSRLLSATDARSDAAQPDRQPVHASLQTRTSTRQRQLIRTDGRPRALPLATRTRPIDGSGNGLTRHSHRTCRRARITKELSSPKTHHQSGGELRSDLVRCGSERGRRDRFLGVDAYQSIAHIHGGAATAP